MSEYVSIIDLVPKRCGKCIEHFFAEPFLVEAFASVGIEHGKSSGQMAKDYFAVFHKNKHRLPAPLGLARATLKEDTARGR